MALLAIISTLLCQAALGEIKFEATHTISERRLDLEITETHTDRNHSDCIVGGFDPQNPANIYVGGPCRLLGDNGPLEGFRYVRMETVGIEVVTADGDEVDAMPVAGSDVFHAQEFAGSHAEVGVGRSVRMPSPYNGANLFASTTSYLAKADFGFTENSFVVGSYEENGTMHYDEIDVCVKECCTAATLADFDQRCDCGSGCPTTQIPATKGMYKYSIFAGSYDNENATAGASGNGWARLREDHGTVVSGSKELQGYLLAWQIVDMTEMGTSPILNFKYGTNGSITYDEMGTCDFESDAADACPESAIYADITSIKISSDSDWAAEYNFPLTYNLGTWTGTNHTFSAPVQQTGKVRIYAAKPTAQNLLDWGEADTLEDANDMKLFVTLIQFNIFGIEASTSANASSGCWMAYDPDVKSVTPDTPDAAAPAPAPAPAESPAAKGGTTVSGAFKTSPWIAVGLCATFWFMRS